MPSWQQRLGSTHGVIRSGLSSKKKCGGKTRWCREVPDVALDADPQTGYVIYCTDGELLGVQRGLERHRRNVGRGAADGRVHGRRRHVQHRQRRPPDGLREPVPVPRVHNDPSMFNDIHNGTTNNILGRLTYQAETGYDMATGLGSIDADQDGDRPRRLHPRAAHRPHHQAHRRGEQEPDPGRRLDRALGQAGRHQDAQGPGHAPDRDPGQPARIGSSTRTSSTCTPARRAAGACGSRTGRSRAGSRGRRSTSARTGTGRRTRPPGC